MSIRKEIALRRLELIKEGVNPSKALSQARQEANKKYGKGWRDKEDIKRYLKNTKSNPLEYKEPSVYDNHTDGEHWMD